MGLFRFLKECILDTNGSLSVHVNFKLKLDYQSMIEMSHDTRGNRFKLVPKLCKYEFRKQFFVNRVVKLWNMLPEEVVSVSNVSSFKRHLDGFWCDLDFYHHHHHYQRISGSRLNGLYFHLTYLL